MNAQILRNEVKRVMAEHKLNQMDISKNIGVPQANISRFLSGKEIRTGHTLALFTFVTSMNAPSTTSEGDA